MSDYVVTIGADASLLNQELQKAAETLNQFIQGAELTGRTLKQNLGIAEQAQRALKDQIDLTRNKQSEANAEYQRAQQTLRAANKPIQERIQQLKGLNIAERKRRIETWQQTEAYKRERIAIKEANIEFRKAAREKARYTDTLRQYENSLRAVNVSTRNLKNANRDLAQSNGNLGSAFKRTLGVANQLAGVFGFGLGVYGLMRAFRSTVSTIVDFDSNIRSLAAISGATADEMENLSRVAILVGGSSKYGADGVAEMMTQLAKMGFAVEEINNMADGITKLAVASGEELEPSAATVASIIRAMGMDAADTAQIVDTLALSFTQSALDLSKFRESMKYVAPLAKQANFSLEDTGAILAKLADAGISGSLAGTSLRNVFSALADQSSALSKALGGNITDFDTFIVKLEELVQSGLSTEEIFKLIDRRAVTALATIAGNTGVLVEFRDNLENAAGAADEMSNIQMQALAYQTKMAGQAWNSFILAMDKGDNLMSNLIRNTLSGFSSAMNEIARSMTRQSKQMESDLRIIDNLNRSISDSNLSFERRMELVEKLSGLYPEMFAGMDMETAKWKEIEDAIEGATKRKREYLRIQFLTEDIDNANKKLKEHEGRYASLSTEVRSFFENLSEQEQEMAIAPRIPGQRSGSTPQMQLLNRYKEEGYEFNQVFKQQLYILGKAVRGIRENSEELETQSKLRKELATIIGATESDFTEIFKDEIAERTEFYVSAMKKQADAAIEAGIGKTQAFDTSTNQMIIRVEEQMRGIEALNEKNREQIALIQGNGLEERKQRAYINHAIQSNIVKYGILKKVILAVLKAGDDATDQSQGDIKLTEQQLRLEQRLAEARARIALDGIELEDELSRIRLYYANEIADATLSLDELDKTKDLNRMQRQIDLQNIEQNRIKQRTQLEDAAHKRKMEQLNLEQQLLETGISGIGGETPKEIALNREMALLDDVIKYEQEEREKNKKREIESLEDKLESIRISHKEGTDERARLEQDVTNEMTAINENFRTQEIIAEREANRERRRIESDLFKEKMRYIDEERKFRLEQSDWLREQESLELSRIDNLWQALDVFGQRTKQQRDLEKQHSAERIQERLKDLELLEKELLLRRGVLATEMKALDFMGISTTDTESEIADLDENLKQLRWTFYTLGVELKRLEDPGIDMTDWQNFVSAMRGVAGQLTGIYQGILDERYRIAQEERSLLDRRISELQRDLDIELRLNEQGFASNVQALMATIEQEKAARDKALAEEKKQAEEKRRLEKVLQTINLLTAVTNIIKAESKWGLPGIASAAAGLAGLWMLWGNQSSKANQSVQTYEKGGSFMLKGPSHTQGGVPLTPRHEAQGGELVSVFNRRATGKYGSEIRSITDAFNKGNYVYPSAGNTEIDTSDIKAIRKILEKESVTYSNGYKIIRKGNTTIRCRLN